MSRTRKPDADQFLGAIWAVVAGTLVGLLVAFLSNIETGLWVGWAVTFIVPPLARRWVSEGWGDTAVNVIVSLFIYPFAYGICYVLIEYLYNAFSQA